MAINNNMLSIVTYKQQVANQTIVASDDVSRESFVNIHKIPLSDDVLDSVDNVDNVFAILNNVEKAPTINYTPPTIMSFATTVGNLSEAEYDHIKQMIFELNFPKGQKPSNPPTDPPADPPADPVTGPAGTTESDEVNFPNTTQLFTYMNSIDSSITKSSGLTKSQLVAFTRNDSWEDSHNDFFGSINRVFEKLDSSNNDILSFDELKVLLDSVDSYEAYKNKIIDYSNEIQTYYSGLSDQQKLDYALEKTREYLDVAGLKNQSKALDRLLNAKTDTFSTVHKGQIAIRDLNVGNTRGPRTLGAYSYWAISRFDPYYHPDSNYVQSIGFWVGDEDSETKDVGLTLDISLLNGNWYELVDTLVHELTHATAYLYFTPEEAEGGGYYLSFSKENLKSLLDVGALTQDEYNYYSENLDLLEYSNPQSEEFSYIMYKANCAYGEYIAYQTDADYVDSIAGDVYDGVNVMSTAVNGAQEQSTIENHIDKLYNTKTCTDADGNTVPDNEPMPDWKWYSYA